MIAADSSVEATTGLKIRPAVAADQQRIADLIFFESHVHRHLDWRTPLDWLGSSPYWLIEENRGLTAALACPPDPDSIAWIRLFAYASHLSGPSAWSPLWEAAWHQLAACGGATVAAIATQRWFDPILIQNGFKLLGHIVLLEWNDGALASARVPADVHLRTMTFDDLPKVVEVDAAAFDPLWRNSLSSLSKAYSQSSYASIAEDESGVIGYQLSTGGTFGAHLARLAVLPGAQGRGLGAALVNDLIARMQRGGASRVTVNTQANNAASLALYDRLGFRRTGERYPVYTVQVT